MSIVLKYISRISESPKLIKGKPKFNWLVLFISIIINGVSKKEKKNSIINGLTYPLCIKVEQDLFTSGKSDTHNDDRWITGRVVDFQTLDNDRVILQGLVCSQAAPHLMIGHGRLYCPQWNRIAIEPMLKELGDTNLRKLC